MNILCDKSKLNTYTLWIRNKMSKSHKYFHLNLNTKVLWRHSCEIDICFIAKYESVVVGRLLGLLFVQPIYIIITSSVFFVFTLYHLRVYCIHKFDVSPLFMPHLDFQIIKLLSFEDIKLWFWWWMPLQTLKLFN